MPESRLEVRRTIVLPGDIDRKISKLAFAQGKSANELIVGALAEEFSTFGDITERVAQKLLEPDDNSRNEIVRRYGGSDRDFTTDLADIVELVIMEMNAHAPN